MITKGQKVKSANEASVQLSIKIETETEGIELDLHTIGLLFCTSTIYNTILLMLSTYSRGEGDR